MRRKKQKKGICMIELTTMLNMSKKYTGLTPKELGDYRNNSQIKLKIVQNNPKLS